MVTNNNNQPEADYQIGGIIDAAQVPNWTRRPPKWQALVEQIMALEPSQTLTVSFKDRKVAERARNTVRDAINLRLGMAVIRTRVVNCADGSVLVYFVRLHESAVVEEKRVEPSLGSDL